MTTRWSRLLALAMLGLGGAQCAQAQVVISQVYGGGGNSGATYTNDFIELHNTGTAAVDLSGYSVQYASASGTSWAVTALSGSLPAGGYYLVQEAKGSGGSIALPTPDASGGIAMSGTAGKVALVASATALSGACPSGAVDLVGFGGTASCYEGSGPTPAPSNTLAVLRAGDGCTDGNDNATDFATGAPTPRNRASAAVICGAAGTPVLSIADASGDEGAGPLVFTLTLSQPAPSGGIAVDYATADGTATAGSDYVASSGRVTLAAGQTSATVSIALIDDSVTEADETFSLTLSNLSGAALLGTAKATGTIVNDDLSLTAIHDIQGAGIESPRKGALVYTTGIVTAVKNVGFWIQTPDAEVDSDPATSEGLYVYTGSTRPAAAVVGNLVRVSGTVQEYVPSADPYQRPLTELSGGVTATLLASGQALPAPIALDASMLTAGGGLDQLERFEGMRVTVPQLRVVGPTGGFTNEVNATGTTDGQFYAVIGDTARPFREPGIEAPTPVSGAIPQWDGNPEILTIDSDTLGGASTALDLAAGAVVSGLTGPLDYSYRHYVIVRDPSVAVDTVAGPGPTPARAPNANEFTVAGYNMERFFDTTADGNGAPTLTPSAFANRLSKASVAIRDYLRLPDILAVVEMENLATLQKVADKVNADAVAQGLADPQYVPYLKEGNDVGGIDVGFLVKTATVGASVARVEVSGVTQYGKDTTWTEPSGATSLLNDRPPLALDAVVHWADGRSFPITVIAVHQRSLNGADTLDAAGERVRAKRQAQAVFLADLIQGLQTDNPERRITVLGDFNAFQFNDGYVDALGTITGLPSPDAQTLVPGDGADLVNPDLTNLGELLAAGQNYSYTFGGSAQTLDHVLVNDALVLATTAFGMDHARINADFPEVARNDATSPARLSDHDPVVAYFELAPKADLAIAATADAASVVAGQPLHYTVNVRNNGPEGANAPGVGFSLAGALPDMTVVAPAGWSCDAAQVADGMTSVACNSATLDNAATADFSVSATSVASQSGTGVTLAVAATSQTFDPDSSNNQAVAQVQVTAPPTADVSVSVEGSASIRAPQFYTRYVVHVANAGQPAANAQVLIEGNTLNVLTLIDPPRGWSCRREGSLRNTQLRCVTRTPLADGAQAAFPLWVTTGTARRGSTVQLDARVSTTSTERDTSNNGTRFSTAVR
ncbi:Calx-beta domain-containing protein [Pseudoxanthomonas sp. USHLN014]|uniref:Calx-beta domain-containing protein n=1 Tax=Pseudoxanthomonas sp. USHLN014 TaxID=3081297 RepID=UPI00301C705A